MKKIRNHVIGGIRHKVINLVLFTLLLVTAAYTAVTIYQTSYLSRLVSETNDQQKQSIVGISQRTMKSVLDSALTQSTQLQAQLAGDYFGDTIKVVNVIADYTEHLFEDPDAYIAAEVLPPDREKDGTISAQLLTEEGVDVTEPGVAAKLGLIGNLTDLMTAVYRDANVDSCYAALPDGVMLLVDDHSGSKFNDDGEIISIPIRDRMWYKGAAEKGGLYFTDVTKDLFTGEIGIMCSVPVYVNGELAAVIGADLFLNDMAKAVENASQEGSFIVVVNENGHVIFSPRTEGEFRLRPADDPADLRESENAELAAFVKEALSKNTELRVIQTDGETYYASGAKIPNVGWAVLDVVMKTYADTPTVTMERQYNEILSDARGAYTKNLKNSRLTLIVLLIAVALLATVGALVLSKRIVKPLGAITERVSGLGGDDLRFRMEDAYRTGDEIEVLAESFAALSSKTLQYIDRVEKVTAEKERIGAELAIATRIQADMLPNIYPAFPDRAEFDIYASMDPAKEVGGDFYDFFLVDDDHLCMVTADVSGKGVPAALFMMASKIIIANNAMQGKSPGQILTDTNAAICKNNREEMFVTVWLGILEISTGRLTAANAGHEYPVIKKPDGAYELYKDRHGFVIGGMAGIKYKEYELMLEPGSKLFVYTDGVPEASDPENKLYGMDRMLDALNSVPDASPVEVLNSVRRSVDAFVKDAEQFDDLTMLCMEYRGIKNAG